MKTSSLIAQIISLLVLAYLAITNIDKLVFWPLIIAFIAGSIGTIIELKNGRKKDNKI